MTAHFAKCKVSGMEIASSESLGLAARLREVGISESYAWQIAHGHRRPSKKLAIRVWRSTGLKLGPIADAADAEIEVLARFVGAE